MTRGREAARAARRREAEVAEENGQLRTQMAEQQERHEKEADDLKAELRRMRADHFAEASRIAGQEVTRRLAEAEAERRRRGVSDDLAENAMYKMDRLVRNACRYLSMTTGQPPGVVLPRVFTWITDENFYGLENPSKYIVKIGLPRKGWTWREYVDALSDGGRYRRSVNATRARRNRQNADPMAVCLDAAERSGHADIHPDYKPEWYPRVEYAEMTLLDGKDER